MKGILISNNKQTVSPAMPVDFTLIMDITKKQLKTMVQGRSMVMNVYSDGISMMALLRFVFILRGLPYEVVRSGFARCNKVDAFNAHVGTRYAVKRATDQIFAWTWVFIKEHRGKS